MMKPGALPGWLFLRPTSIVGGWWKYMCKVFLGDFSFGFSGLGDLEVVEGVDRFFG